MGKKDKEETPRPDPPADTCNFFLEKKRRYCRHKKTVDTKYCAEHATIAGADLGRKRVFCPYDAKHTCYADKLRHHMKKCPSQPREMPAYYSAGINSGDDADEIVPHPKQTVLTVPVEELQRLIENINQIYEEHIGSLVEEILSHSCMKVELENKSYGVAAIRHRKQQASLIGQMEKVGLLTDDRCFLEMGAGKGQLSHWLHGAVEDKNNIGFVLIDRSHVRNKMDNLHKEQMIMERIRIDIEHLRLDKIPSIEENNRSVVAFGKHLCGAATDLALRCVTETLDREQVPVPRTPDDSDVPQKRQKRVASHLGGAVIALCCHHRCAWMPYVGKPFFKSCGLTARDFQVISSMSSWATCAWKGWSHLKKMEIKQAAGNQTNDNTSGKTELDDSDKNHGRGDCETPISTAIPDTSGDKSRTSEVTRSSLSDSPSSGIRDSEPSANSVPVKDKLVAAQHRESESNACDAEGIDKSGITSAEDLKVTDEQRVVDNKKGKADEEAEIGADEEMEHCRDEHVTNAGINSKLSEAEREVIGRKCKRLIDYGRVCYLQEHGMTCGLKTFIEEFYTPENVVLVATTSTL